MQVPMGLFLVTCTRTRAWTPASGPRTFLSARGTNTRVPKSVSCPLHVAKLAFQAAFPRGLRTTGRTHALAPRSLMDRVGAWSYCSHKPCPSPTPASQLLTALLAPLPPAWPLALHSTRGHRPCLPQSFSGPQASHRVLALCRNLLPCTHPLCGTEPRPPSVTPWDRRLATSAIHGLTCAPPDLPFTLPL